MAYCKKGIHSDRRLHTLRPSTKATWTHPQASRSPRRWGRC
jgi:hypothetical protein